MSFIIPQSYELIRRETLDDIGSEGVLVRHKKSGARVMILENEDDNKVFNIAFRTTPKDSSGEAHIIEHTVLCGSRKYPSKDPFVELVKGSMNTFLNAITYPDKTMFPVASTNDADFRNLMDVYLDAVFYPNIYRNEAIFRQEGWSYQIERAEDPIVYNGVVYNEMKGAYSSPDEMTDRTIMHSLFPDTTYGEDSGGMPEHIPELTYEDFLNFHRTYYHPSNSYLYLYGKMDMEERLTYLDREYLSHFDRIQVDSQVSLQTPFDQERRVVEAYPVGEEDSLDHQTYLTRNCVIGQSTDILLCAALDVLEEVLLETPGAPLKRALIDAGIGTDIYGSFDSSILQPVFSIVAKNADQGDQTRFEEIIETTLAGLAEKGLSDKEIEAAINSMEFRYREADFGGYPKGLIYSINVFDSWLYDEDMPFDYLKMQAVFMTLREKIGTGYYEGLIRERLLGNPHTSYVTMVPERGLTSKAEDQVRQKLASFKASLSQKEIGDMIEKTRILRDFQQTPSSQEDLEKIPMLKREDLRPSARHFSNLDRSRGNIRLIRHDYQTNGIAYVTLVFDLAGIRKEDLPILGILRHMLGEVDTARYRYQDLATEIGRKTGGINPAVSLFQNDQGRIKAGLSIEIATLPDQIDFAMDMAREILLTSSFTDKSRVREILQKMKSRLYMQLTSSGHSTSAQRVLSYLTDSGVFTDGMGGIGLYDQVTDLEKNFDASYPDLCRRMQGLLDLAVRPDRMLVSYTGDESHTERILAGAERLARAAGARMGGRPAEETDRGETGPDTDEEGIPFRFLTGLDPVRKNEGFRTPGKVQYVARGGRFSRTEYSGALNVLKVIMNYDYLWQNLRVVGGAYGCGGSFSRSGTAVFYSYRDPHLTTTIKVYEGIPQYLRDFQASDRDMTKFVIGTISDFDTPLTPRVAGARSLVAYLIGQTFDQLQKERDQVLQATQEDIRALAPLMEEALSDGALCVVGSEDKINQDHDLFGKIRTL